MSSALADPARHSPVRGGKPQRLGVHASTWRAVGITSYELRSVDGTELPQWAAGAHVDVHLPSGTVRQYSLCGDPTDLSHYRIAVLEQPTGRGGSVEVHRELRPGVEVEIGAPRADFTLVQAERYVFVAGGIGVTPLLPMVREVHGRGGDWQLVYAARTPSTQPSSRSSWTWTPTASSWSPRSGTGVPTWPRSSPPALGRRSTAAGPRA